MNKEEKKEYDKIYYRKNKERKLKQSKKWYSENKGKHNRLTRDYYYKNKEIRLIQIKEWQKKNNYRETEEQYEKRKIRNKTRYKYGKPIKGWEYHHYPPYRVDFWELITKEEHKKIHGCDENRI